MDIDYFKKYNDTHGHRQGDMILARLAGLLKATLRNTDILARYGERSSRRYFRIRTRITPLLWVKG